MKRLIVLAMTLLLLAGNGFAQSTSSGSRTPTAPTTFTLTINLTPAVSGATYFVDNVDIKGNVTSVSAGNHTIRVTAPGYQDFTTTVNITANTAVPVSMRANSATLTVQLQNRERITNLKIYVDNAEIRGTSASLALGNHVVRVTATGYQDFTTSVSLTGNMNIPVTLIPSTANLTISIQNRENIANLKFFVDNAEIRGTTATIPLGNHTVRVTAANYVEFTTTVNLTGDMNIPVTLMAATATINVSIPASLQNQGLGRDFIRQIFVYIDGAKQNLPNNSQLIIPFGQHTIRIETGGLQAEVSFNFQAGVTYTIEPVFSLTVKQ